jgi:mRNA-degrading endonuclease RelE of RelBE toxin-antitoxin system
MFQFELSTPAFTTLEALPQIVAFKIIKRLESVAVFPNSGVSLEVYSPNLKRYRQIIVSKKFRVIYRINESKKIIYVVSIQYCRQKLPSARELNRLSKS